MKCPECAETGQRSKVYSHGVSCTLMGFTPYYDEDGFWHSHDPNKRCATYSCSNAHDWYIVEPIPCPNASCDYGKSSAEKEK